MEQPEGQQQGLTVSAVVLSYEARGIAPGGVDNGIHIRIIHGLYQSLHMHQGFNLGCTMHILDCKRWHEQLLIMLVQHIVLSLETDRKLKYGCFAKEGLQTVLTRP